MAREKRGDEALVRMLIEDARLAAAGTPKARENRKRPSKSKLYRQMVAEAVCGCGEPAVISVPRRRENGSIKHVKKCIACAGLGGDGSSISSGRPETPHEVIQRKPVVKGCGIKVFA